MEFSLDGVSPWVLEVFELWALSVATGLGGELNGCSRADDLRVSSRKDLLDSEICLEAACSADLGGCLELAQ
jgi:hypothetical protein